MIDNIQRRSCILYYVVSAYNLFIVLNPYFLRQVLVFIRQCIRVFLQFVLFLLQLSLMCLYPWVTSCSSIGGGGGLSKIWWGGFEWVGLRRCSWYNFGAKYLMCQAQSWTRRPVRFLVLQGTWGFSSAEHPGLWPRNHNFDTDVNPACFVRKRFVHFHGHESSQSGEYN